MKREDYLKAPEIDLGQCEKKCPPDVTPEQEMAIDWAEQYRLGAEVEYAIFEEGMSPMEALEEWDLLPIEPIP